MDQSDLLRYVTGVLEKLSLRYFVTGSVVAIFFGEPRFTNDIDVVVDLKPERIQEFCAEFPQADFYLSEEAVRRAVRQHSQFNIIHPASGLKVDVMIPSASPFNSVRFSRAARIKPAPDYDAVFSSPEDVILKKMEYYREGGSDKHLRDIAGILKISADLIDRPYIADWAARLELSEIWDSVLRRVDG
jgi:hypothetical protein